ncbi:MAG: DUF255 domain-containing protein [Spirochaetota bacterium]|nr:DUF255 domain-containing protein [Spirochaetota bacterium]
MKNNIMYVFILSIIIFFLSETSPYSKSSIQWHSFNSGLVKAKKLARPVVIDFYAKWCTWCKVMDKKTFSDEKVIEKMNRDYVAVKVNMESNETIYYKNRKMSPNQFSRFLGIQGLPSFLFMDKNGEIIMKISGFKEPKVFSAILGYVRDGCYKKNVPFMDYMNGKVDCK